MRSMLNARDEIMKDQKGFTLVELLEVLILTGILFAVAVPKVINLTRSTQKIGIGQALIVLNNQEMKCWTESKFGEGWTSDADLFQSCDYEIENYRVIATLTKGLVEFEGTTTEVYRSPSTRNIPGKWTLEKPAAKDPLI